MDKSFDEFKLVHDRIKRIRQLRDTYRRQIKLCDEIEKMLFEKVHTEFKDSTKVYEWWLDGTKEGQNKELLDSFRVMGRKRSMKTLRNVFDFIKEYE